MRIGLLNRWLKGLPELEAAIAAEREPFSLFALIEIEKWNEYDNSSAGSSWHLFVAAPWIWAEGYEAEEFLRERVQPYEDPPGFQVPSLQIEVVKPTSRYLEEVWEYCSTENGMVEVYNVDILDVTALRGYIFASRRPEGFSEIQRQAQLEYEQEAQRRDLRARETRELMRAQRQSQGSP